MVEKPQAHSSGEEHAQIVVRVVGLPPIHVRALRISVTDIDEVAIRRAFFLSPIQTA